MGKPLPIPDEETSPYWEAAKQHQFALQQCERCTRILFPPKPCCPDCLDSDIIWVELSGNGIVYSFCVMHLDLIKGYEPPYVIAQVQIAEQHDLLVTANIVDCPIENVHIGMSVGVTFEDRTEELSLPQFRPIRTH